MSSMFAYIGGSSFVFINVFGLGVVEYGLIFGLTLGHMVAARLNIYLVNRFGINNITFVAFLIMLISSVLLVLFSYNFYTFSLFLFFILFALGFVAPNLATQAMSKAKECSGSASALIGAVQFGFAGLASFFSWYFRCQ